MHFFRKILCSVAFVFSLRCMIQVEELLIVSLVVVYQVVFAILTAALLRIHIPDCLTLFCVANSLQQALANLLGNRQTLRALQAAPLMVHLRPVIITAATWMYRGRVFCSEKRSRTTTECLVWAVQQKILASSSKVKSGDFWWFRTLER